MEREERREGGRERIHLDLASNAHVRNGVPRSRKVEENEKLWLFGILVSSRGYCIRIFFMDMDMESFEFFIVRIVIEIVKI